MVNKPKNQGTKAESAFAAYLTENGWPSAERRSLQGALDKGDITGTPGVCWEVKSTRRPDVPFSTYLKECVVETVNAKADFGVVVVKTKGYGDRRVGEWLAVMYVRDLVRLDAPRVVMNTLKQKRSVRFELNMAVERTKQIDLAPIIQVCPPGKKEVPEQWHAFTTVAHMVNMLRWKGYGEPLSGTATPSSHASASTNGWTIAGESTVDGAGTPAISIPGN